MIRTLCLLLVFAAAASAQASDAVLSALLQEIRQLRQDLSSMTLASQRVQVLLYRMQLQDDAAKRAKQRYEQATTRLHEIELARNNILNELKSVEEKLTATQDGAQRVRLQDLMADIKRRVDAVSQEESTHRAAEVTAASEVRSEEAKLSELQERLDRLEKQLDIYSR